MDKNNLQKELFIEEPSFLEAKIILGKSDIAHKVSVMIDGEKFHGELCATFKDNEGSSSAVMVIKDHVWYKLPPILQKPQEQLEKEIAKRIEDGKNRTGAYKSFIFDENPNLMYFAYKHGWVPGVIIAQDLQSKSSICMLTNMAEEHYQQRTRNPNNRITILNSYNIKPKTLFFSYIHKICDYFDACISFSSKEATARYCKKIRNIASESLEAKLDDIERCKDHENSSVRDAANKILTDNSNIIYEAKFARDFSMLLVNYLYQFLHISHKTRSPKFYHEEIEAEIAELANLKIPITTPINAMYNASLKLKGKDIPEKYQGGEKWASRLVDVARDIGYFQKTFKKEHRPTKIFFSHLMGLDSTIVLGLNIQKHVAHEQLPVSVLFVE